MYMILWEFRARAGREPEFERAYGPDGDWVRFFHGGQGYLGTELLRAGDAPRRYVTIDRWASESAYRAFRSGRRAEYEAIDRRCEALTETEIPLGSFTPVASA